MMTDAELEQLLLDHETDRLELKESLSDGDHIREAICAFANDLPNHQKPGAIVVGLKDDGTLRELRDYRRKTSNPCGHEV